MANTWPKMTEIAIVNFFNLFLAGDMKVDRKHTGWFFLLVPDSRFADLTGSS